MMSVPSPPDAIKAEQDVIARVTGHHIIAATSQNRVVTFAAKDKVVSNAGDYAVIASTSNDSVVAIAGCNSVIACARFNAVVIGAVKRIICVDHVAFGVARAARVDDIIARGPLDDVVLPVRDTDRDKFGRAVDHIGKHTDKRDALAARERQIASPVPSPLVSVTTTSAVVTGVVPPSLVRPDTSSWSLVVPSPLSVRSKT